MSAFLDLGILLGRPEIVKVKQNNLAFSSAARLNRHEPRISGVQDGHRMTRWLSRIAAPTSIAAALVTMAAPALAEKRVALVIGNNDYRNVP
jgi:hypothetical protein